VALARALATSAPVLLLDDPLSAVDPRTESAILDALEAERGRRTLLLITHRVAAAERCDRIVVLERGKVVARGTHRELIAEGGLYAAFAAEQQLEHDLDVVGEAAVERLGKPGTGGLPATGVAVGPIQGGDR
jgi:ATP-binding cassette subfamily B protein